MDDKRNHLLKYAVADHSYMAATFDSEGCVRICPKLSLEVSLSSIFEPLLEAVQLHFGGKLYSEANGRNRTIWRWKAYASSAIEFLEFIEPYSIIKHDEIIEALRYKALLRTTKSEAQKVTAAEIRSNLQRLKKAEYVAL